MKTVFSGIQPTGNLHLGNYLGSIRNWINLQDTHRCIFGVMNLHAITLPQDPKELRQNIIDAAAVYLACGLDPKKSTIFVQSEVPQHAELAWVLGTMTPLGWLNRMTQFKDKSLDLISLTQEVLESLQKRGSRSQIAALLSNDEIKETVNLDRSKVVDLVERIVETMRNDMDKGKANLGLYAYPVLMASDILLYKADCVPVGEDQKQHLELTRDIAGAFNHRYKTEYFKLPEPMILKAVKRIMSLQDGTSKMSKSDESDLSRINLEDSPELIVKKIKKAKTDSQAIISFDESRPEIFNLLNIFSAVTGKEPQELAKEYENSGFGKFKGDLAENLVEKLKPIQENLARFKQDKGYIEKVLADGQKQASEIAIKTRDEVFSLVGLK
jgi:tryptophanyl-tRNA synthetase